MHSFTYEVFLITMGLIYQSNVETSADPCAQINLRQSSRVIYETFVCRQSHRTKDRTLINVAAENNRHLNITPLKTPRFRSHAPRVYDTEKHNPAKKRKHLIKEKLILLQKHPLTPYCKQWHSFICILNTSKYNEKIINIINTI